MPQEGYPTGAEVAVAFSFALVGLFVGSTPGARSTWLASVRTNPTRVSDTAGAHDNPGAAHGPPDLTKSRTFTLRFALDL